MSTTPRVFESGIVSSPAGAAVPAGAIGETIVGSGVTTNGITGNTPYTTATVTLNKGVYLVIGKTIASPATGADSAPDVVVDITTSSSFNPASGSESSNRFVTPSGSGGVDIFVTSIKYLTITADSTTVYLRTNCIVITGTVNLSSSKQYISAIRIA